ncbi:MAG: polysaccharide biosynthesis tyrosine autokinase [Crocinitomix sp.]|nr:polysaccharide biosynthesis tyrosine autokinase [Crocinitomix sp.]
MQGNNQNKNTPSNKLIEAKDILFIWKMILKNLGFIIAIPLVAYAIGYVYTYRLTNIYGAKAELLLKSNETYDYQDPIYKGLGAYGIYMDVQNQIRILNSRDLIGEVIDKINIGTSYYVVGRIKKVEVFETLPFKSSVSVLNPQLYEVPIQVTILNQEQYKIAYSVGGVNVEDVYNFDEEVTNSDFVLQLDRRYELDDENISELKESDYEIVFHSRNYLINKYQSGLHVENIEHTSVITLSVNDELANRAIVYLDTLTNTYVDYSKRSQLEVNENTLTNIQKQIDTVSILIQQKERELLLYKDQNAILNINKEEDDFFAEYISFTKDKRMLEQKKGSVVALSEYLKSSEDNRVLPPSFYIEENDEYLREAIGEVRKRQIRYEIDKTQKSEENRTMIQARKEIAMLNNDILNYLENLLLAFNQQITIADSYIRDYKNDIRKLPKSAQGVMNIQRELDVNNKMYLFLLEKKTNTLIARAGIIPQVKIIEKTVGTGVVYPNKTKIIRLFILGGFIFAFLIAIIRKLFFEKIENVNDLAEVSEINIAGGVPFVKDMESHLMIESQPKSHVTESFRTIRTNLTFIGKDGEDGKAKKVLLSSFFPGEGKTFCSTNLANLIAKGSKKVLIIDFDLHRPKVHKTYKLQNVKGVSNYIIGKSNFEEILNEEVYPNLDVITAGPIAPNPSELVLRDKVLELIEYAEKKYDYIIIDTPPFGLLNDTLELTKYVDMFLIIMNTRYTRKKGVEHINHMLEKFDDIGKGVVLNGIKESRIQYYYSKYTYKYTYGYNYGYGYGYGSTYGSGYTNDENY